MARLSHPNLLHVYSVGSEKGCYYFAMELLRGETLSSAVRRLARRMDSDETLKDDARRFVGRFGSLVVEALAQDQAAASGLLGSDQGRVFLLLDASVSPAA